MVALAKLFQDRLCIHVIFPLVCHACSPLQRGAGFFVFCAGTGFIATFFLAIYFSIAILCYAGTCAASNRLLLFPDASKPPHRSQGSDTAVFSFYKDLIILNRFDEMFSEMI
jgi:hypothetical protein